MTFSHVFFCAFFALPKKAIGHPGVTVELVHRLFFSALEAEFRTHQHVLKRLIVVIVPRLAFSGAVACLGRSIR
jgi:hypothetical protein